MISGSFSVGNPYSSSQQLVRREGESHRSWKRRKQKHNRTIKIQSVNASVQAAAGYSQASTINITKCTGNAFRHIALVGLGLLATFHGGLNPARIEGNHEINSNLFNCFNRSLVNVSALNECSHPTTVNFTGAVSASAADQENDKDLFCCTSSFANVSALNECATKDFQNSIPIAIQSASASQESAALPNVQNKINEIDLIEMGKLKEELELLQTSGIGEIKNRFKNVPKNFDLNELANLIFVHGHKNYLSTLLHGIHLAHPSFVLSPYNQIRRAIVDDDRRHRLSNKDIISMFKEHGINDAKSIEDCYNLAYRINHPYIYEISQIPVPTSDYSLNFLWINLNPQDRSLKIAKNIFGEGINLFENHELLSNPDKLRTYEETQSSLDKDTLDLLQQVKKTTTYKISRWADKNPGAHINLWYDSALVMREAQLNTFELMKKMSQSRGVDLKLRDIRHLPNVQGETEHSLHPGTALYYRVDLLKALIADHMIDAHEEHPKYFVFSDIDIEPMTSQQLFDQRTLNYLSLDGYVFNRVGIGDFENSFFIFNKEKESLKKIHNQDIIQKAASIITKLRGYPIGKRFQMFSEDVLTSQSIYNYYAQFKKSMGEPSRVPRKVVKCPESQFNKIDFSRLSDHQLETFRFIGDSNIPYTKLGRNHEYWGEEKPIDELRVWKAEPLPDPS